MEKELIPQLRFSEFSKNWEIKDIKNIAKVVGGGTPSTTEKEYWNGNINWFTPTEIKFDIVSESKRKITDLGLKKSSATLLPKGAILLTTRATIGEMAIAQEECTTNQGFQSLVVNKNNSNQFVFDLIKVHRKELYKRANGSTFKEISKKEVEKIKVLIPKLPEQQKIASFLSDVDDKITKLTKKKVLLEQYKKGIMQKIFNQELRFKDDNGINYPIWEEKKITTFAKTSIGLVTSMTKHYVHKDIGVPLIRNSDIMGNKIRMEKLIYLDKVFSETHNNRRLKFNDVVTVHTGDIGVSSVINKNLDGCHGFATLNTRIKNIKEVLPSYLSWYFNSERGIRYALSMATGDGRSNYNLKDFNKAIVPIPHIKEQTQIANFLSDIDLKLEALNTKIENNKSFKKGLLQKMFV
jgi:type I restriction enzyme S subunit